MLIQHASDFCIFTASQKLTASVLSVCTTFLASCNFETPFESLFCRTRMDSFFFAKMS